MTTADTRRSEPAPQTASDLDGRKAAILNAVVTEYIGSGQPVGSQYVVEAAGIK